MLLAIVLRVSEVLVTVSIGRPEAERIAEYEVPPASPTLVWQKAAITSGISHRKSSGTSNMGACD